MILNFPCFIMTSFAAAPASSLEINEHFNMSKKNKQRG